MDLSKMENAAKGGSERMRIAILGSGAMGMLFGGYLSRDNEVILIDIDRAKVDKINQRGIRIKETAGSYTETRPRAVISSEGLGAMDLVMLFVKAMDSRKALASNRNLIGPNTFVMSLQNGSGHESVINEFVAAERIVIGTTQHNSSIIEPGIVHHGAADGPGIQVRLNPLLSKSGHGRNAAAWTRKL
jgi:2-dehydropantoate 2-reductase